MSSSPSALPTHLVPLDAAWERRVQQLIAAGYQLSPPYTAYEFAQMVDRMGARGATWHLIMDFPINHVHYGVKRLWEEDP